MHPDFKPEIIGGLIQFIADWSALGARPQMGFGVIQVEGSRIDMQPLHDWLITTVGSKTYPDLPSLQNIFLAQIQPKDSKPPFKEQDTFNLKYDLRQLFRAEEPVITEEKKILVKSGHKGLTLKKDKKDSGISEGDRDKDLRHFIMGAAPDDKKDNKTHDKRMAAKIKISRAYDNGKLMRVWGWVPEEAEVYKNGWNREKVVKAIHHHLTENYALHTWREMNSDRDTKAKNISDAKVFLRSLLKLPESNHD